MLFDTRWPSARTGGYVQIDETPVDYLDPGRGKAGQGYLWTCASPQGDVLFH
jgi:transposase